jgi:hypothetical protein
MSYADKTQKFFSGASPSDVPGVAMDAYGFGARKHRVAHGGKLTPVSDFRQSFVVYCLLSGRLDPET